MKKIGLVGKCFPFFASGTLIPAVAAVQTVDFTAGVPADGDTLTVNDNTHTPTVFEFDSGAKAAGQITVNSVPADADTVSLSDGVTTKVFEFDSGAYATSTLTDGNASAPANGSTIQIGSKTYTFKTTLTPAEGEVLINGTADAASPLPDK